MERGKLIVTTESPKEAHRIKLATMVGSLLVAAVLILNNLTAPLHVLIFSLIIAALLGGSGIVNYCQPESFGAVYENAVAGMAETGIGIRTIPFEIPFEDLVEVHRYKRRGQEKFLLLCTRQGNFRIFCRANQEELTVALLERIAPEE
ncbi:MAG: hypothetical protein E7443_07165 [Ruminococcaceae bacterium]|nr:hypothetical protein [Oscillospiraceae bacterium]